MDVLAWVLAALFISNVVLVAAFAVVVEARRRRDERALRALEVLWQAPPRPAHVAGKRRGGVRVRSRREVLVVPDAPRQGIVRTGSLVLALASIVAIAAIGFLDRADPTNTPRSLGTLIVDGSIPRSTDHPQQPRRESQVITSPDLRGDERDPERGADPVDLGRTTEADVVPLSGEESVSVAIVASSPSTEAIRLDWAEVPGATAYRVDRREERQIWLTIALRSAESSTYTDTGLVSGTTYYYRVIAQLEDGWAPASDVVSATTVSAPPVAPSLTGNARRSGIILAWTDVADETGYRVERMADGESIWTAIATTGEGIVEYKDGILTPGASYQYRVVAVGPGGDSVPSNVVQVTASTTIAGDHSGHSGDDPGNKPAKEQALPEGTNETP